MVKRSFFTLLIIVIAAVIQNCNDAGQVADETQYKVSGTIESWTQGSDKKLRAIVTDSAGTSTFLADSTTISSTGAFELNMKTPPDNFFFQYALPAGLSCNNGVTVSPSNLKNAVVAFKVYNASGNYIGKIEKKNFAAVPVEGSYWINYFHYNTNGSVLGDLTCGDTNSTVKYSFNLVCTNSWKAVVGYADSVSATYQHYVFNQNEPSGIPWKFSP